MNTAVSNRLSVLRMGMLFGIPMVLALAFSQNAHATPSVSVGTVQYIGTGCGNAAGDSISGSGFTRTLNLRNFNAGAGYALRRSSCNAVMPVTVQRGYQMSLTANFKGSVKGRGKLTRSYGTSRNPSGASFSSNLASVRGKRFSQDDAGNGAWSGCGGESVNARLNSSIMTENNASKISVDKMTLRIAVRPCR